MIKYFAYGSNMNREQMKERCPDSRLLGRAVLKDYKLAFTTFSEKRNCGCADVVRAPHEEVWGLLYEISPRDLAQQDAWEGYPDHYGRFQAHVTDDSGQEHLAEIYEVVDKGEGDLRPSAHYLGLLQEAASTFGFPKSYQNLLAGIPTVDQSLTTGYSTNSVPR